MAGVFQPNVFQNNVFQVDVVVQRDRSDGRGRLDKRQLEAEERFQRKKKADEKRLLETIEAAYRKATGEAPPPDVVNEVMATAKTAAPDLSAMTAIALAEVAEFVEFIEIAELLEAA